MRRRDGRERAHGGGVTGGNWQWGTGGPGQERQGMKRNKRAELNSEKQVEGSMDSSGVKL